VDQRGHRRPTQLAALLVLAGTGAGAVGVLAGSHLAALGLVALLAGAGSAIGMIAVQRTAGALARTPAQRLQVFSWLALAPSAATLAGPLLAGALMDRAGFAAACAGLAALPLLTLVACRAVPPAAAGAAVANTARAALAISPALGQASGAQAGGAGPKPAWGLLADAPLRRLFFINWLIAAAWDAHALVLPLLGHQRGLGAQVLAMVLACYAVASAAVRLLIPVLARRLPVGRLMTLALALSAGVLAAYPWLHSAWAMAACAALLGLGLGAIQPAVMASLHALSPPGRQGEVLGLRSTLIHFSTLVMPLGLGALGAAAGVGTVLWLSAAALSAGAWQASRLPTAPGDAR